MSFDISMYAYTTGEIVGATEYNKLRTNILALYNELNPIGLISIWPTSTPPDTWLLCAGQNLSLTTYEDLFDVLVTDSSYSTLGLDTGSTVTFTAGASDLVNLTSHGFTAGTVVIFTTSGTLPTGLTAGTKYYVVNTITTDTFQIATTAGGSAIDLSDTGSGTHTVHVAFTNLDLRGRIPLGKDNMGGSSANRVTASAADNLLQTGGSETHTLSVTEMPAHTHTGSNLVGAGATLTTTSGGTSWAQNLNPASQGGGGAHNNVQPYITLNYIIRATDANS